MQEKAIKSIVAGRKIGTFFTNAPSTSAASVETLAENGTSVALVSHFLLRPTTNLKTGISS